MLNWLKSLFIWITGDLAKHCLYLNDGPGRVGGLLAISLKSRSLTAVPSSARSAIDPVKNVCEAYRVDQCTFFFFWQPSAYKIATLCWRSPKSSSSSPSLALAMKIYWLGIWCDGCSRAVPLAAHMQQILFVLNGNATNFSYIWPLC